MTYIDSNDSRLYFNLWQNGYTTIAEVTLTFTPAIGTTAIAYDLTPTQLTERFAEFEIPSTFADDVKDGLYNLTIADSNFTYLTEQVRVELTTAITTYQNDITVTYKLNGTI